MRPLRLDWDADTTFPVDIETVKKHLRILDDQFDEILNDVYMPAAVEWAEGIMHRSILSKAHRWVLSDFPRGLDQSIQLPRGKTQSVASIAYVSNNATTTLTGPSSGSPEGTDYREDLRGNEGGIVLPAYSETWPSVDTNGPTPVLITLTVGWTAAQVPGDVKNAIMMYCADALDLPGGSDFGANTNIQAKESLLSGWRLVRC